MKLYTRWTRSWLCSAAIYFFAMAKEKPQTIKVRQTIERLFGKKRRAPATTNVTPSDENPFGEPLKDSKRWPKKPFREIKGLAC